MVGLIGSSIVSGLIVSRTGRYKWLIVGSVADHGLRGPADDPADQGHAGARRVAVDVHRGPGRRPDVLGARRSSSRTPCRSSSLASATSNLTFFRQIGGTIALAFVGTIFATSFKDKLVPQMSAAGVPQAGHQRLRPGREQWLFDFSSLTGVGDLGSGHPGRHPGAVPGGRPAVHRPTWSKGVHGAFSLATAQTFWLGVVGSVVALVAAVAIKEIPLRTTNEAAGPDACHRRRLRAASVRPRACRASVARD